ncbi:hypothetical protein [Cerasicoccus arenae]|uniref:O-antigen polysaccharide polymerase Wzy n=1 Tax=Cerasicoccus arenae TaxID=424488 RepID=A0A8J3GDI9_9BACT|nr:hypothetical protein [Cerasicoccus arenae]MBK1857037.1 hypothetical protein [Cerasicoccus arenae]GHB92001.1 hypothetical protein GCM10007047_03710 [Cerasicoccus arenae]
MNFRGTLIGSLLFAGFLGSFQIAPNDILALAVFGLMFLAFYRALETHIPIIEITACIATLQWLVGPVIGYRYGSTDLRYEMYVDAARYFSYAIPGTCFYLAALFMWPMDQWQALKLSTLKEEIYFRRGIALLIISLVAQLIAGRVPGSLAFFFFLLTQLRYVGAIYFLFSGHRMRYLLIIFSIGTLVVRSAESAMFHDLIIWVSLIACFWYQTIKWSASKKAVFFTAGFICVFTIQLVKADYRAQVWSGRDASLFAVAYDKIVRNQAFFNEQSLKAAGQRINQGWIISAIMLNVPMVEPYANGDTIKEAVISSIFPRAIMKNKALAGGKINFEHFTGLRLESNTSMGISILGEAYGNYGSFGGAIFMFIWGLAYATIYRIVTRFTHRDIAFLFWIPLVFYQAIKAETELLVVLNQLIKGSIVAYLVYTCLHHFLVPDQINQEIETDDEDEDDNEDDATDQISAVN